MRFVRMKTTRTMTIRTCLAIVAIVDILDRTSSISTDDSITITVDNDCTLGQPSLGYLIDFDENIVYNKPEERQKLCYYAKLKAGIAFIDYDYVPGWVHYSGNAYISEFDYGMYCGTIPTIYLFWLCDTTAYEMTTQWSYQVRNFKFDTHIVEAHAVSPTTEEITKNPEVHTREDEEEEKKRLKEYCSSRVPSQNDDENNTGFDLDKFAYRFSWHQRDVADNRRQVCFNVQETLPLRLHFLRCNIPEPQQYEFEDTLRSQKELHWAISCPTLPKLYLRAGKTKDELIAVIVPSIIDHYEYEAEKTKPATIVRVLEDEHSAMEFIGHRLTQLRPQDRTNLCAMARKNEVFSHVPYVKDADVSEAHLYTFEYPGRPEKREVAVLCPAIPLIYLRLDESEKTGKIKITFPPTVADNYVYNVQLVASLNILNADELVESTQRKKLKMEAHPLVELNEENRWGLCWAAQKRILNNEGNRWNFRFASQEPLLSEHKLLLIPKYMEGPRWYEITHFQNGAKEEDMVIQCSVWPKMHLRLGKTPNEIEILLQEIRYFLK